MKYSISSQMGRITAIWMNASKKAGTRIVHNIIIKFFWEQRCSLLLYIAHNYANISRIIVKWMMSHIWWFTYKLRSLDDMYHVWYEMQFSICLLHINLSTCLYKTINMLWWKTINKTWIQSILSIRSIAMNNRF